MEQGSNTKEPKRKRENWPGIKLMKWCREFIEQQRKEDWKIFIQNRFQ